MRIIRGKYGRRRFDVPTNITARPTTDFARENIFNVLDNYEDFEGLTALDLFAGTGAITLEFASRGCEMVTAVEKASTQYNFIRKVVQTLNADNIRLVKGDVWQYVERCTTKYDLIFADPPYDLENFDKIPELILNSNMLKDDTIIIIEHSRNYDFSGLPHFWQHRTYGSVNFSLFRMDLEEDDDKKNE